MGPAWGLQGAPGIVPSRGRSVGSVPLAGSCYMVTVIFVVCLGIVFTLLQRINNCHKKTASLCMSRTVWGGCRLGRSVCMCVSCTYASFCLYVDVWTYEKWIFGLCVHISVSLHDIILSLGKVRCQEVLVGFLRQCLSVGNVRYVMWKEMSYRLCARCSYMCYRFWCEEGGGHIVSQCVI